MPDTVADVLVRLGVDTAGLRAGFRDARTQTTRFARDLEQILSLRGGPLGVAGAAVRAAGGVIPGPAGGILRGIGAVFASIGRLFGGLFTRAARTIAREIQRNFQEVIAAYRAGSVTLGEAIQRIEDERAAAIRRLSGKKGGRKELDSLLPGFDRALADLRARQQAVFEQFEAQLELLRVGEAFRDAAADVREIIRQYREYVDAGGELARANEFLSRSLEELRHRAAGELAEGERRAIEDALRLNQLLQEREDLLFDFAEQERRIRARGVLERQRPLAQQKAAELEALRRRRDERLAELDQDIRLLQLKVDAEARIFALAQDRIALETRLLELRAREIEKETERLLALKQIAGGIFANPAGATLAPSLQQVLHLGGVHIVLGPQATPAEGRAAGEEVIEGMLRALAQERERLGLAF